MPIMPPPTRCGELLRRSGRAVDRTQAGARAAGETHITRTDAALWVNTLAAWHAGWPERIRSPRLVLAHVWEGVGL